LADERRASKNAATGVHLLRILIKTHTITFILFVECVIVCVFLPSLSPTTYPILFSATAAARMALDSQARSSSSAVSTYQAYFVLFIRIITTTLLFCYHYYYF
jgi:hypothetical protein